MSLESHLKRSARPRKDPGTDLAVDFVAWAERANARWIVHHGLGRNTEAYLKHLERTDPERRRRCCRNAYLLVRECAPLEDPKPWFYAGLFSLATAAEAREFLAGHCLVAAAIAAAGTTTAIAPAPEALGAATREKIGRIREALAQLPAA